jgi:indole-3-glycerol phosphate synthase
LSKHGINFICEIKKASPPKRLISDTFNYKKIAFEYQTSGAAAISVLTEPDFFSWQYRVHLQEIKNIVRAPVLRKDFIIDSYQIYESKIIGADAILISSLGVTGIRSKIIADVRSLIDKIKKITDVPVAVGFGISNASQAKEITKYADGVIIGSAVVKIILQKTS